MKKLTVFLIISTLLALFNQANAAVLNRLWEQNSFANVRDLVPSSNKGGNIFFYTLRTDTGSGVEPGRLLALNPATGQPVWISGSVKVKPPLSSSLTKRGQLTASDANGDGNDDAIIGYTSPTDQDMLAASNGVTGINLWTITLPALTVPTSLGFLTPISDIDGDNIKDIIAARDGNDLFAFSGATGAIIWQKPLTSYVGGGIQFVLTIKVEIATDDTDSDYIDDIVVNLSGFGQNVVLRVSGSDGSIKNIISQNGNFNSLLVGQKSAPKAPGQNHAGYATDGYVRFITQGIERLNVYTSQSVWLKSFPCLKLNLVVRAEKVLRDGNDIGVFSGQDTCLLQPVFSALSMRNGNHLWTVPQEAKNNIIDAADVHDDKNFEIIGFVRGELQFIFVPPFIIETPYKVFVMDEKNGIKLAEADTEASLPLDYPADESMMIIRIVPDVNNDGKDEILSFGKGMGDFLTGDTGYKIAIYSLQ